MELCDEEYRGLAKCFTLPDGVSMLVKHLKGYTEETLKNEVERQGGPRMLVPGWLEEKGLRRFLDGYVSPTITKKAKAGDGSSNSSSASPGKWPS